MILFRTLRTPKKNPAGPIAYLSLAALLLVCAYHVFGVFLDVLLAIDFPYEIAYGEGVVWQQALLIPGPRAYSLGDSLPFLVFHYPPFYHLTVRLIVEFFPDYLAAGRFVSASAGFLLAAVSGAVTRRAAGSGPLAAASGIAVALLMLCIPNLRAATVLMRVDLLANALSIVGLLIACSGRPSLVRSILALLFCTTAVFTKQTEIVFGVAVALAIVRRNIRQGLVAVVCAGLVGALVTLWVIFLTNGGFLQHIIGYNVNRFDWWIGLQRMQGELPNLPFAFVAVASAISVAFQKVVPPGTRHIRSGVLLAFIVSTTSLLAMAKSGASYNYLNDLYITGTILFGIALSDAVNGTKRTMRAGIASAVIVTGWVCLLPFQRLPSFLSTQAPAEQAELVRQIAAAPLPVATDDIVLVLRAGRTLMFEPAIVAELALTGQWDEKPLLQMIEEKGFSFVMSEHEALDDDRRSPNVAAAFARAYPVAKQVTRRHWVHYPAALP